MEQERLQEITERLSLNFDDPAVRLKWARYYQQDVRFLLCSFKDLQEQNRSIDTEKCRKFQDELSGVLMKYGFCGAPSA